LRVFFFKKPEDPFYKMDPKMPPLFIPLPFYKTEEQAFLFYKTEMIETMSFYIEFTKIVNSELHSAILFHLEEMKK